MSIIDRLRGSGPDGRLDADALVERVIGLRQFVLAMRMWQPAVILTDPTTSEPSRPEAAIIARTSGSFSRSCDSVVTMTWVSLRQPSANSGRTGRSISRETSVSFSDGRPSRLKKPPGILPAAKVFS